MKNEPTIIEVERTKGAIEEFWTQERISASQPIEMPTYPPLEAPIQTQPEPTYEKANPNESPAGACGALHVSKENSLLKGSACAIAPRIVLTAAHCVYDQKNRECYSNLAFFPRYWGNAFAWKYPIKFNCLYTFYIENPGITWDFAMSITYDDMTPQIGGYLDANVNYDFRLNSPVAMFGYPSGLESGNVMYRDNGYMIMHWPSLCKNSSALAKLQNCGAIGVSGGPWLDATNRVVGLNAETDCKWSVQSPNLFEGNKYQWLLNFAKSHV